MDCLNGVVPRKYQEIIAKSQKTTISMEPRRNSDLHNGAMRNARRNALKSRVTLILVIYEKTRICGLF